MTRPTAQSRHRLAWVPLLAALGLGLGGCGLDDDSGDDTQSSRVTTQEAQAQTAPQDGTVVAADGQVAQTGQTEQGGAQDQANPQPQDAADTGATTQPETTTSPQDASTTPDASGAQADQGQNPFAPGGAGTATTPEGTTATAPEGTATPGENGQASQRDGSNPFAPGSATGPGTVPGGIRPSSSGGFMGGRFFSDDSPWNTPVADSTPDERSSEMLELANQRIAIVERRGGQGGLRRVVRRNRQGVFINTRAWAPPVVNEERGVQTRLRCRQRRCGPDAITSLAIPRDVDPDPQYDGWYTVLDRPRGVAYDFWRARRERDNSISYHYVTRWDLNGPGFQAPQRVSARGSGLPLFAGLVQADDIQRGKIDHALAISIPGAAQRRYVQPASRTDGNGRLTSLPEGARIRLLPGVRPGRLAKTGRQRRFARMVIEALQEYGAIVVDRAAVPTLYAQRNVSWRRRFGVAGNELQNIKLEDFEVVELGPVFQDPPVRTTAPERTTAPQQEILRGQQQRRQTQPQTQTQEQQGGQ